MKPNNKRYYFKCYKCGAICESDSDTPGCCCAPMLVRTSGICGGGYNPITKDEYDRLYEQFNPKPSNKTI